MTDKPIATLTIVRHDLGPLRPRDITRALKAAGLDTRDLQLEADLVHFNLYASEDFDMRSTYERQVLDKVATHERSSDSD